MAEADGKVYIDTEIDTDGFKAGGKEVEQAARRMAKTVKGIGESAKISLQKQTDAFVKQNQMLARQQKKVADLEKEYVRLSNTEVETEEFKEIGKQIDADTTKLDRLIKAQEEFLSAGGRKRSNAYTRRENQIEELRNSIRYAKGEQQELLSSGLAYKAVDTNSAQSKLSAETEKLMQMQTALGTSYESLKQKVTSYGGQTKQLTGIKGKLISTFDRFRNSIKKTNSSMSGLGGTSKKTGLSMRKMLATSLLLGFAFRVMSSVMSAMAEGMNNLAQYSDSTNADLSAMKSSLTQLKNSFATAFAPILSIVTPILTKLMDVLAKVITYIGIFFSVLSGKGTYLRAVEVQEDYAAGLKDTASSAKEAEEALRGYLSPIDEINKMESVDVSSGSGGASGTSPGQMFEEVEIDNVDGLRKIFENILDAAIAIGAAIATWKISSLFSSDLSKIAGLTSIAAGITLLIENIEAILSGEYENVSLESAIKTAISGLLIGAGVALMSGSLLAVPLGIALAFTITDIIVNWDNITAMWDHIGIALDSLFSGDWEGFFANLQSAFISWATADSWYIEIVKALADGIFGEGTWDTAMEVLNSNEGAFMDLGKRALLFVAQGAIESMAKAGSWVLNNILTPIRTAIRNAFGISGGKSSVMSEEGGSLMNGLKIGISNKVGEVMAPFSALKNRMLAKWGEIKTNAVDFALGVKDKIVSTWNSLKERISQIWSGIVTTIKGAVNSVIGVINGMIRGMVTGINNVIRALNGLNFDIPDWVPGGLGGKEFGLSISTVSAPQIPYLATGAVIPPNAPFMAVLGDQKQGTNIETPERLLRKIMREELGSRQTGGTYKFIGQINRRVLFEEMMTEAKLRQSQNGRNPFSLA